MQSATSHSAAMSTGLLVKVAASFQAGLDRALGYFGQDRFVCFYYEPRGEEVLWRDSRSYGFGTGAWFTFMDAVQPVGASTGAEFCPTPARHVLVLDRQTHSAYFARRQNAEWFFPDIARHVQAAEAN